MAFLGALERVREEDSPSRFLIKGGMACELRFQGKARATRDLDAIFRGSLDELLADLDAAFAESYSGFSFSYSEPEAIRETGSHCFDVKLTYASRSWATLRVEVSAPEGKAYEPEIVPALTVTEFGHILHAKSCRTHETSLPSPVRQVRDPVPRKVRAEARYDRNRATVCEDVRRAGSWSTDDQEDIGNAPGHLRAGCRAWLRRRQPDPCS
jgi:hypothetical protein